MSEEKAGAWKDSRPPGWEPYPWGACQKTEGSFKVVVEKVRPGAWDILILYPADGDNAVKLVRALYQDAPPWDAVPVVLAGYLKMLEYGG